MHNFAQTFKTQDKAQFEKKQFKKLYPSRQSSNMEQLASGSYTRSSNWAKEKMFNEDDILQALNKGVIPLKHIDEHDFRATGDPLKDNKPKVYVRNYLPATQRAEVARQDFCSTHLEQTPYVTPKRSVEKERVVEKEVAPMMRHGVRTQNERLNNHLNGPNRLIDAAIADNKMIFDPNWRDNDKSKWISPREFDTTTCFYQGRRSLDPWKLTPLGINVDDPYTDGFEVVGDLSRKRFKDLEISPKYFNSTVTPNHNSMAFLPPMDSNSIRTSKAVKFFAEDGNANQKTYPKSLHHLMTQHPDMMETPKTSSNHSEIQQVIQIKKGLEPMKESMFSSTGYKTRSDSSPTTEKSFWKTGMTRRGKNASPDRGEYIKHTVKSYFD